MGFTVEKDSLAPYPYAPQYEYIIEDNDNRYGVDRTESGYDLYLIDEDNVPIADGRTTQEWNAFYRLGWTKQELHNGIKNEWESSLLPPFMELEDSLKEIYGDTYKGEDIRDLDGDVADNLYLQHIATKNKIERKETTMSNKLENQKFDSLEELDQWAAKNPDYAHVKIPCEFITPYTHTAKDGREFDKAYVSIPKGTSINGVDISGYSCSVFMSDRMKQQQGDSVTLSFKDTVPVTIWTGKKDSKQYPYKKFEVNPWDLVKAVAAQLRDFREQKVQERNQDKGVSLSSEAQDSRNSSDALSGKEPSMYRLNASMNQRNN